VARKRVVVWLPFGTGAKGRIVFDDVRRQTIPVAFQTYRGHSSIQITYDRYGRLMPGNEDEAAALLDAYLERANTTARLAQIEG
jgi:integrase